MIFQCLLFIYFGVCLSSQGGEKYFRRASDGGSNLWSRKYSDALSPSDCDTPKFDHGKAKSRLRGKMIKFVCYPNYALVGNRYATCVNGQWDEPLPVCVKPGCQTVPTLKNGMILRLRQEAWLTFFCFPGFILKGSPAIYCDGRQWNSTMPYCQDGSPPKLTCDFENEDLCGWRHDELHDFDWIRLNKKTPSAFMFTGPSYDHTFGEGKSGHFMYIESTSKEANDTARLISPIYNASLTTHGCFSLYYHMYGSSMGGLRVYQKPENLPLATLLTYSEDEKRPYIIFEKWNNQGDFWFQSVTTLRKYTKDFQIIIEGIRGHSFTSDIAIDDVAIIQGDGQCAQLRKEASTPPTYAVDSCIGRCGQYRVIYVTGQCGCHEFCLARGNCCNDYVELCVFSNETTTESYNFSESSTPQSAGDNQPQTQKLVGTTAVATTVTTTPRPTVTTSTTSTTIKTTTKAVTTTRKPSTTVKSTAQRVTSATVTTKTIPRPIFKNTTVVYNATDILAKHKNTSAKNMAPVKANITATTAKSTSTIQHGVSRTLENHDEYHHLVEEAKKRQQEKINVQKTILIASKTEVPSYAISLLILLAVIVCISGMGCVVWGSRSAQGRAVVARLRGRVIHDPEVRFLTQNADDE